MTKAAGRNKLAHKPKRPTRIAKSGQNRGTAPTAWWLIADVEVCAVCGENYAYGAGYRCSGCDAAVCAFCIEDRSGEIWCVEC